MSLDSCRPAYEALDPAKRAVAVMFLRRQLTDVESWKNGIDGDPEWFCGAPVIGGIPHPWHFIQGMGIRNALRDGGFGEDYWPVENIDDIYVSLIEEAVLGAPLWETS